MYPQQILNPFGNNCISWAKIEV